MDKLRAIFQKLLTTTDQEEREKLQKAFWEEFERQQQSNKDTGTGGKDGITPELQTIIEEMNALKHALLEEKRAREEALKRLQEKEAEERKRKIDAFITEQIKAGRIAKGEEEEIRKDLEADFERVSRYILKRQPVVNNDDGKDSGDDKQKQRKVSVFETGLQDAFRAYAIGKNGEG